MKRPDRYLAFASRDQWRGWLEEHHAEESEAWLLICKKKAARHSLSYEEATEEALCYGWIDGLLRSYDAERFALRYSPRKRRSVWSEGNKRKAERLMAEGRMTQAGLQKIAEAKGNGEWDASTAREDVDSIPADLALVLEGAGATAAFKRLPPSRRKGYLFWLSSAKRPETRQKRIQAVVELTNSTE
jgi:uncharacterized protein YdeI (YjbR/CyaY-like superfamily)